MPSSNDKRIVSGDTLVPDSVKSWDAHRFDAKTHTIGIGDLTQVELEGLRRAKEKREIEQLRHQLKIEQADLDKKKNALDEQYAQMLDEASKEAELLKAKAQQQGYEDGFSKAEAERQNLIQFFSNLQLDYKNLNVMLAHRMKELAVFVSQKIVGDTAKLHPENALKNLEILLDETRLNPSQISIKAHPVTISVIEKHLKSNPSSKALNSIQWITDEDMLPTGFVIHHEFGEVDFSMESRWKRVLAHFDLDDSAAVFMANDLMPAGYQNVRHNHASTTPATEQQP